MTKQKRMKIAIQFIIFYSLLWWAFTDGSTYQIWLGGIFVALASSATLFYSPNFRSSTRIRVRGLLKLIPYFIIQSFKGGFLVTKLAFLPQRFVHSQFFDYPVRISREDVIARMYFASCLCVFPGTLSCGFKDDTLIVHALDTEFIDEKSIRELEDLIAGVFASEI